MKRIIAPILAALAAFMLCIGVPLIFLLLTGCGGDRAQAAADLHAGHDAAQLQLADLEAKLHALGTAAGEALVAQAQFIGRILTAADAYVDPASGVPKADQPAPRMTPAAIGKDPAGYGAAAPPEPSGTSFWGIVTAAGLGALLVVGKVAPQVLPGIGPVLGGIATGLWTAIAPKDHIDADKAQTAVATAAGVAQPLFVALQGLPLDVLPPQVATALKDPRITSALEALVSTAPVAAATTPSA